MTDDAPQAPSPYWFPATYLLHATEEYCCGETFPVWISRLGDVHFTAEAFLWLNGVAMAAMLGAAWLAASRAAARWLAVVLATVVAINGALHVIGSLATWSWSPGVVTGALLWLPLGATSLRRLGRVLPRRRLALGVSLGMLCHAAVSGAVLVL